MAFGSVDIVYDRLSLSASMWWIRVAFSGQIFSTYSCSWNILPVVYPIIPPPIAAKRPSLRPASWSTFQFQTVSAKKYCELHPGKGWCMLTASIRPELLFNLQLSINYHQSKESCTQRIELRMALVTCQDHDRSTKGAGDNSGPCHRDHRHRLLVLLLWRRRWGRGGLSLRPDVSSNSVTSSFIGVRFWGVQPLFGAFFRK